MHFIMHRTVLARVVHRLQGCTVAQIRPAAYPVIASVGVNSDSSSKEFSNLNCPCSTFHTLHNAAVPISFSDRRL
jgi:hypothetical protein